MSRHTVIIGDSRRMKEVADESVHLICTSPPYWQLKDYGSDKQIGFNDTYDAYINNLNLVWKECFRVLHKGCRLCINIGDQFARSVYYGRYKVIPIRTEIIKFCETIGFDYMGAIIWQKVTTCNTTGGATIMGSFPYPRNGILKLDYEFILIFRKHGVSPKVSASAKEKSRLTTEEWNTFFSGHWNFPGEKQARHIASFPIELPNRLIKMFSFVGDTVLDPFLGSGTTSLSAMDLDRNSIGYEINSDFLPVINDRLGLSGQLSLTNASVDIKMQESPDLNPEEELKEMPYFFKDPVMRDKKMDPKKMSFGSRIDGESRCEREDYYRVKKVVSAEELVLDNGMRVRLIGVKRNDARDSEAIRFLSEKTSGQKVFIRFDDVKYDTHDNLLCYVYLRNKTFLNAHLIRLGLANVDTTVDYRYRTKFLSMRL